MKDNKAVILLDNPSSGLRPPSPTRGEVDNVRGFTLIELLVVVLIIGILAAVAVPQYNIAVEKSRLAQYIPLVHSLAKAEETYFLINGQHANDLVTLDIEPPVQGCTYRHNSWGVAYVCKDFTIGIFNSNTNVQLQTPSLAYAQFIDDFDYEAINQELKRGDVACFSKGYVARQVCKSLSDGTEYKLGETGWNYIYIVKR